MQDLTEQLAYEKDRADKAEAEIERIKTENKAYQEILEGESLKKEGQIRKLKEEAIIKDKTFKAQKAEVARLQAQIETLKESLVAAESSNKGIDPSQLERVSKENVLLKQQVSELSGELSAERGKGGKALQLQAQRGEWEKKEKMLREDLDMAKNLADELKKYNTILNQKLAYYTKPSDSPQKKPKEELERINSKKDMPPPIDKQKYEERIKQLEERLRQYEQLQVKNRLLEEHSQSLQQSLSRQDRALKESKLKIQALSEDNESLQAKFRSSPSNQFSPNNHFSPQQSFYPSPTTLKESAADESGPGSLSYSCLLLTKPHFISPFLEVYEDKGLIQIYKSTRAGCYERSMGCYRHKFDRISFDQEAIIEPIVRSILESEETSHHSIVFYGVKRSGKKELMSKILVRLKDFLMSKLQGSYDCEALFINRSQEEARNSMDSGNDKRGVMEVMNKVMALGYKTEKGRLQTSPKKMQAEPPKVRYFSFQTDHFRLELATSSYTNLSFRTNTTPAGMLNHILYSRLPDVLQSSLARQHLVLTLNPIVDLYEDCRNTLSATFCRTRRPEGGREWRGSPVREELNDTVRRRFDSIQRQNEQTQLRSRKFQEECHYYRARFDELEFRLKGLLNTYSGQTSYLKKSPVTLSYEKLLKFVHTVQARSAIPMLPHFSSMALKPAAIYIEKDNESVDAL